MMRHSRKSFLLLLATGSAVAAVGCGDEGTDADTSTGGSTSTGGTTSTGGAPSTGGTQTTTGGTTSATGGVENAAGSDGSGGDMQEPEFCDGDRITALCSESSGHAHVLYIPVADILAGVGGTYRTEMGMVPGGNHCHQVILTAEDMTTLRNGGVVRKTTCNAGDHEFVLSCAADPPQPVVPTMCGGSNEGECPMN